MNCRKWKRMMLLEVYGELDAVRGQAFRDHLSKCAACAKEMESFRAIRKQAAATEPARPSKERVLTIRRYLDEAIANRALQPSPRRLAFAFRAALATAFTAALVFGAVVAWRNWRTEEPTPPTYSAYRTVGDQLDYARMEIDLLEERVNVTGVARAQPDWFMIEWEVVELSEAIRPT